MAIYDDAVVDAQKLREVAESAAKQQILEAITPRIRDMINSRILREQDDSIEVPDVDDAEESDDDMETSLPVSASTSTTSKEKSAPVVINNTGDIHIEAETEESEVITDQMAESLARLIRNEKKQKNLKLRVENLGKNYQLFKEAVSRLKKGGKVAPGQKKRVMNVYRKLAQEAISLRREVVANGGGSQRLEGKLVETLKEMRTMSSRTKRNIFDFLFEGDDEDKKKSKEGRHMDEAELSLTLDDDEKSELADKSEDEIEDALMGVLGDVEFEFAGGDEGGEDSDDSGDDAGDDDSGDDDTEEDSEDSDDEGGEELDLGEMDEMGMQEGDMEEGDMEEAVYEIDESALRRELGKMKRLRESRNLQARKLREARARRARMVREQAEDHVQADQFGGAEEIGDVFYDVDEDSLVNVLADELGSVSEGKAKEARLRKAMQEASEYRKAAESLKGQLVEMNLFNAKLLYANKLMQNKDLTVKQQRAIVEALDNAKTLREAKLLYKSLSESLARRTQKAGTMSESVNRTVLGSSSRSTRSAQPASSGVEVDRWAVLAGISEGK